MALRRVRTGILLLAALGAFAVSGPAGAAPRPSVTLVLIDGSGGRLPGIDVSDVSLGLSRTTSPDKPDEMQDQVTMNLDTSVLSNAAALGWVGKGGGDSSLEVTVQNGQQTTKYLLSGITTWSLNTSHTTSGGMDGQVGLAIGAKHLSINGLALN